MTTFLIPDAAHYPNAPAFTIVQAGEVLSAGNGLPVTAVNGNANGQATSANSSPVVLPSDQSPVASKAAASAYVDGSVVTIGSKADAPATDNTSSWSAIALLKAIVRPLDWTQVYSTTQTGVATWAGSGSITGLGIYRSLMVNINLTAITGTSIQFVLGRKDKNNNFIFLKQSSALTTAGTVAIDVGDSLTGYFFDTVTVTVNLVAITSVTFTVDVEAR